jgi:ATP/ADP translocase
MEEQLNKIYQQIRHHSEAMENKMQVLNGKIVAMESKLIGAMWISGLLMPCLLALVIYVWSDAVSKTEKNDTNLITLQQNFAVLREDFDVNSILRDKKHD